MNSQTTENCDRKFYRGLRLLFWMTTAEWAVVYLAVIIIPLGAKYFGALDQVPAIYRWVRLVPALTGIPILVAIFRLTARRQKYSDYRWIGAVRLSVRLLIGFELFARWVASPVGWAGVVWHVWSYTNAVTVILISVYLAAGAVSFGRSRLARGVVFTGIAFVVVRPAFPVVLGWLLPWVAISDRAQMNTGVLLDVLTGIAVLWALQRCCKMWRRIVEERCVHCAYSRRGLLTRRCPECGEEFRDLSEGAESDLAFESETA